MRSLRPLSGVLAILFATLLAPLMGAQQSHHESDRVTSTPDARATRLLGGHVPRWADASGDLGTINTDVALDHLTVMLTRSAATQAAFEQLLADQQNPGSPRYHQWLTPQQVGEQFGPTEHDVNAVTGWLASQGLRVDAISPSRTMITFSGGSGAVARALGTRFHRYLVAAAGGVEERLSIGTEPAIPAALEPVIAGFHGLAEQHARPQSHAALAPATLSGALEPSPRYTTSSGSHYIAPADFVTIFDLQPAYNQGINGTGVKVAVIGRSRVLAADITSFQTLTGLSSTAQPVAIIAAGGTDPGLATGDQSEQTLDVNRVMGTAPGAETDLVISASSKTTDGIDIAIDYEVATLVDPIMTISYGDCEITNGSAGDAYYSGVFSTAAAEGITTFISSGDSAAAGCANAFAAPPSSAPQLSINFMCANPYVTCVGGTELSDTASPSSYWSGSNGSGMSSALSYIPEGAWNEPQSSSGYQIAGTGGGVSLYVTKPYWQTGVGVPADGFRDTPDVSLPAARHDGYFTCLGGSCSSSKFYVYSGTSAAAPGMAGIMALVVQKAGAPQGNFNPQLYTLAAESTLGVFHDATPASSGVTSCSVGAASMCNNSTPSATALTGGTAGYALTTGYDLATGWGSVDVARLISSVGTGFTVSMGAPLTLAAGGSGTSSVQVASVQGFTGTVALRCAITSSPSSAVNIAPSCTVTPVSTALSSGSSTNVVVTISTTARKASEGPSSAGMTGLGALAACLLPGLILVGRRRLPAALLLVLLTVALAAVSGGCGGNSAPAANGTNAGTYQATVTGSFSSITASGFISITVN